MSVLDEIAGEVKRQKLVGRDKDDAGRTWSEWAAIVTGYVGRAVPAMYRNEGISPREMMVKAAATIVAAIESMDSK